MATGEGAKAAVSRIEELRRVLASTPDPASRARLRVELSDLLRGRSDPFAALTELRRAAGEAPQLPCVRLALLSAAAELAPGERAMLLSEHARGDKGVLVPMWAYAAASARAENGAVEEATRAFLDLAGDARVPVHRRRAAARQAEALAAERAPRQQVAALRLQAGLSSGRGRLTLLRRAVSIVERAGDGAALLAVAADWLAAGGTPEPATMLVRKARQVGGGTSAALASVEGEIARRSPQRAPRVPPPSPARRAADAATKVMARSPRALLDEALAAARAGRPLVARRRAERAVRLAGDATELGGPLALLDATLKERGALRDALLLRRTRLETATDGPSPVALNDLAIVAESAGLVDLGRRFRAEASPSSRPAPASPSASAVVPPVARTPAEHYLSAQRALAQLPPGASTEPVLTMLRHAVAGHPAADEALALGESLLRKAAPPDLEARLIELLREANGAEGESGRRARIAGRLATALEARRDPLGAVAVLDAALEAMPGGEGNDLRQRRARLLRDVGRPKDLAVALQLDIPELDDDARRDAYAERAQLLDADDPEAALEIRLEALKDNPADLPLLSLARRRLDATGRADLSLRLAKTAVVRLTAGDERLPLLRDIAHLSETWAHDLNEAATAWLEVAHLDPADVNAAESAERLLMASGAWERCAALLSWRLARAPGLLEPTLQAALLWRLAELRRERLGQDEEARRLYGLLGKLVGANDSAAAIDASAARTADGKRARRPVPALADPSVDLTVLPPVTGEAGRALALCTLRAAVAPTPAALAQALLDRALFLADPVGRIPDAQRDLGRALQQDPRNVDVVVALERIAERTGRWAELAADLRDKATGAAPEAAARLWYGVGRIGERQGDREAAREAYTRASALDPTLLESISALRRLATAARHWPEVARLLDAERALMPTDRDHAQIAAELAAVLGEHLQQPARAVELLESALAFFPDDTAQLQRLFDFSLAAGGARWEQAGQVLERLLAQGVAVEDAAQRYYRVGEAAAADGHIDRALGFYSRSYGRDSGFRPTLERLSRICFELGQWDNAWKASEALLDRHRPAYPRLPLAELLLRSATCDVAIAQRATAAAKVSSWLSDGGRAAVDGGVRDVAESWSNMGLEPRLLVGLEGERRERTLRRAAEALTLASSDREAAAVRVGALQLLAAVATVEGRWADALRFLGELAGEESIEAKLRAGFLITAGDIHLHEGSDPASARGLYQRAAALAPQDQRLLRRMAVPQPISVPASDPIFAEDEEPTGVDLDVLARDPTEKYRL